MDGFQNPYIALLKEYSGFIFDGNIVEGFPVFTYMDQDAEPLAQLEQRFQIREKICGKSEIDAILCLLDWVYQTIPYDGFSDRPEEIDANFMLGNPKPANCLTMAAILNAVYLSVGFKSRMLFCLPADYDGDNHVVTMVYLQSLAKWISVDPSHNTYFMSADGGILNPIEARQIFANGEIPFIKHIEREMRAPLICGGIPCKSYDDFYLLYMSKNCFRFKCPVQSEYLYPKSSTKANYVILNPIGYDKKRGMVYDAGTVNKQLPNLHYTSTVHMFLDQPSF